MKTPLRALSWVVALGAIVAIAVLLGRTPLPIVSVQPVALGTVEATVANTRAGTVNARRRAKLAPGLGGQVAALHVKAGDRVAAGQVLLELWHEDLDAQLALATSERLRATALADEARLRAEFAEREAARQQELVGIASPSEIDRLVSAAQAARAGERAALAEAESRGRQIEYLEAQVRRMIVTAPFAGIVAEVNAEVGEFATPSPIGIPTPPAVDLIDDGAPYVTAPIDEVDAASVQVGMPARITVDAFGRRPFAGTVRRIAPYVLDREKQARTVDVEVAFDAPPADVALLPGYSADVEVLLAVRDGVLRVPSDSVRDGHVLLVADDSVLVRRPVRTGLANWRFTEITEGLAAGERIVIAHERQGLGEGVRVTAVAPDGRP